MQPRPQIPGLRREQLARRAPTVEERVVGIGRHLERVDEDDALTSILEPIMIVLVGGIVGFIVIAMYMPMFKVYDAIK